MERTGFDESIASDGELTVDRLSDLLGTSDLAINRYRVPSGGRLPAGLHAHVDQEEAFVVRSGEATFETLAGEVSVSAGEAIRFAPGEFQAGRNAGDEPLVVLAMGAPRESEDVRIPIVCAACGHDDLRLDLGDGSLTFACPGCGIEREPAPCPSCSGDDLRVVLEEATAEPVAACQECGSTYERPPVRGEW
ncbi:cupin [Halovivax asiaticus JCM 14624]|uniref:Cupin n=1 Tax=Halovivax asiaticus JCM 14624 TaxID=1227490 RepID=M0BS10_9EURY|nr:cupin domain-containing protein [Halovivax asiaticus]ELZ13791.1 cupin [Halovivax asiaticus JCM 14624]